MRGPSNHTAAENAWLKDKVSALSKQASKFQLELTTARSQLKLMESLAVRLEGPSPGNPPAERSELNNKDRQVCDSPLILELIDYSSILDPVVRESVD